MYILTFPGHNRQAFFNIWRLLGSADNIYPTFVIVVLSVVLVVCLFDKGKTNYSSRVGHVAGQNSPIPRGKTAQKACCLGVNGT